MEGCRRMKRVKLNSQVKKTFQGSSRGFVLLEVLIAIAILGIIAVTFLGALSTTSKTVIVADERTTAESLARRQIEDVKNQIYNSAPDGGVATYSKIANIPAGYSIWSIASTTSTVVISANIVGIPWDSQNNRAAGQDAGLQKIALVIEHNGKMIYTFVNTNPYWATGANITLEAYKVNR
jgi:prepilin-type N-terminal cleavage/methylation domain-containing protein